MENNFVLEETTLWRFKERGNWSTHKGDYRGNWSPYVPRNLILRYTKSGDLILDQFVGSGTTLIEAKILGRDCVGIDVNDKALTICKERIKGCNGTGKCYIKFGDATNLSFVPNSKIDFVCTHPPYSDAITYSNNIQSDLSLMSFIDFIEAMNKVAKESYRVLKAHKYCAIMVGDIRKKGSVVPLGFEVMQCFLNNGFKLREIIIKEQNNCRSTEKWVKISKERNFLLLAHEYLFVFRKL